MVSFPGFSWGESKSSPAEASHKQVSSAEAEVRTTIPLDEAVQRKSDFAGNEAGGNLQVVKQIRYKLEHGYELLNFIKCPQCRGPLVRKKQVNQTKTAGSASDEHGNDSVRDDAGNTKEASAPLHGVSDESGVTTGPQTTPPLTAQSLFPNLCFTSTALEPSSDDGGSCGFMLCGTSERATVASQKSFDSNQQKLVPGIAKQGKLTDNDQPSKSKSDPESTKISEPPQEKDSSMDDVRKILPYCVRCRAHVITEHVTTEQQRALSMLVEGWSMESESVAGEEGSRQKAHNDNDLIYDLHERRSGQETEEEAAFARNNVERRGLILVNLDSNSLLSEEQSKNDTTTSSLEDSTCSLALTVVTNDPENIEIVPHQTFNRQEASERSIRPMMGNGSALPTLNEIGQNTEDKSGSSDKQQPMMHDDVQDTNVGNRDHSILISGSFSEKDQSANKAVNVTTPEETFFPSSSQADQREVLQQSKKSEQALTEDTTKGHGASTSSILISSSSMAPPSKKSVASTDPIEGARLNGDGKRSGNERSALSREDDGFPSQHLASPFNVLDNTDVLNESSHNHDIPKNKPLGKKNDDFEERESPLKFYYKEDYGVSKDVEGSHQAETNETYPTPSDGENRDEPMSSASGEGVHMSASAAFSSDTTADEPALEIVSDITREELLSMDQVERREIAARAIGERLVHGYKLTQISCENCEMPLMEDTNALLECVICPALIKEAKKVAKKRRELLEKQDKVKLSAPKMEDAQDFHVTREEHNTYSELKVDARSPSFAMSARETDMNREVYIDRQDPNDSVDGSQKYCATVSVEDESNSIPFTSPQGNEEETLSNDDGGMTIATVEQDQIVDHPADNTEWWATALLEEKYPSFGSAMEEEPRKTLDGGRVNFASSAKSKATQDRKQRLNTQASTENVNQDHVSFTDDPHDDNLFMSTSSGYSKPFEIPSESMVSLPIAVGGSSTSTVPATNRKSSAESLAMESDSTRHKGQTGLMDGLPRTSVHDFELSNQWKATKFEDNLRRQTLRGWTILSESCPREQCGSVPLRSFRGGPPMCFICGLSGKQLDVKRKAAKDSFGSGDHVKTDYTTENRAKTSHKDHGVGDQDFDWSELIEFKQMREDSRSRIAGDSQQGHWVDRRRVESSKEMCHRLQNGWKLLSSHCKKCLMPLMSQAGGKAECVICGRIEKGVPTLDGPKPFEDATEDLKVDAVDMHIEDAVVHIEKKLKEHDFRLDTKGKQSYSPKQKQVPPLSSEKPYNEWGVRQENTLQQKGGETNEPTAVSHSQGTDVDDALDYFNTPSCEGRMSNDGHLDSMTPKTNNLTDYMNSEEKEGARRKKTVERFFPEDDKQRIEDGSWEADISIKVSSSSFHTGKGSSSYHSVQGVTSADSMERVFKRMEEKKAQLRRRLAGESNSDEEEEGSTQSSDSMGSDQPPQRATNIQDSLQTQMDVAMMLEKLVSAAADE